MSQTGSPTQNSPRLEPWAAWWQNPSGGGGRAALLFFFPKRGLDPNEHEGRNKSGTWHYIWLQILNNTYVWLTLIIRRKKMTEHYTTYMTTHWRALETAWANTAWGRRELLPLKENARTEEEAEGQLDPGRRAGGYYYSGVKKKRGILFLAEMEGRKWPCWKSRKRQASTKLRLPDTNSDWDLCWRAGGLTEQTNRRRRHDGVTSRAWLALFYQQPSFWKLLAANRQLRHGRAYYRKAPQAIQKRKKLKAWRQTGMR